ncbi:MAG: hypothetical protein PHQ12_07895, partial [Chthoniobacteraceae bacterium]|nr:hypothetical protein [Chthoniobacteraceae bacterium]
ATPFALKSPLLGDVAAEAAGLILRQPEGTKAVYAGGLDLRSYRDSQVELALAQPAPLVFSNQKEGLLCFNGGETDVTLTVKRPFARRVTLPPQKWISVSVSGESPVPPPVFLKPLDAASGISYASYLKGFPGASALHASDSIRIKSNKMTLPDGAVLAAKTGAEENVLARWENVGTVVTARCEVPQAGWYRLKIRYCSGQEPSRSLLINGKIPFAEAEAFSLASTLGASPSDGWSNGKNDWREVVLGAEQDSPGWKIYLNKGPCELSLRVESGGVNLDWLELDPS